jgi:hypothetical protein
MQEGEGWKKGNDDSKELLCFVVPFSFCQGSLGQIRDREQFRSGGVVVQEILGIHHPVCANKDATRLLLDRAATPPGQAQLSKIAFGRWKIVRRYGSVAGEHRPWPGGRTERNSSDAAKPPLSEAGGGSSSSRVFPFCD